MTTITLEIPDDLYQRAEERAKGQSGSVEAVLQEALEGYLGEHGATHSRTLAEALAEARAQIEADGTPLLQTWEELEAEIAERRGGYQKHEV